MVKFLSIDINQTTANKIILAFECIALIVGILMIIIGILQNKESQTGLAALNGGNEELFANSKERGKEKVLSIIMLTLGIILIVTTIVILILTNTILNSNSGSNSSTSTLMLF